MTISFYNKLINTLWLTCSDPKLFIYKYLTSTIKDLINRSGILLLYAFNNLYQIGDFLQSFFCVKTKPFFCTKNETFLCTKNETFLCTRNETFVYTKNETFLCIKKNTIVYFEEELLINLELKWYIYIHIYI